MKKILLVDGHSIMNRAYYGLGANARFSAADNTPTGAVFTFLNILIRYKDMLEPTHLCVAFDRKEPTFRHEKFVDYKAHRKPFPEELEVQFPVIKEVLEGMDLEWVDLAGYEADDILGTMAATYADNGFEVFILSGDKDNFQLVNEKITVVMPEGRQSGGGFTLYDPAKVEERYQVTPLEFIDVKALMGDSSDNIPGVRGIGEKTATQLISKYKSLENLYLHLDELTANQRKKLEEGREAAYESRELSTILLDVPIEVTPEQTALPNNLNQTAAYTVLKKYSLNSIIKKLDLVPSEASSPDVKDEDGPMFVVKETSADDLLKVLSDLEQQIAVYLDITRSDSVAERLVLGLPDGRGFTLYGHEGIGRVFNRLCELDLRLIGYDTKIWFSLFGGRCVNYPFDVCSAAYVLNDLQGANTTLAMLYNQQNDLLADLSAPEDLLIALRSLARQQTTRIQELGLETLAYEIDLPLAPVIGRIEHAGFLVNAEVLSKMSEEFAEQIDTLEAEVHELAGKEFKINSPKQLAEVLFDDLGLPPGRKGATQYSTDAEEMDRLMHMHPIIEKVVDYRQLTKLKATFLDGLSSYIQEDGRIHCSFNQNLTATGRLSSSDPNLQNIPVRQERGREIRKAFVASEGHVLIDADYSQIELRLLAHLSGDSNMVSAFKENRDIHVATAAGLFNVEPEEVTADQRAAAKTVNFSIIYGISDFGLSKDLGITVKEAGRYIAGYYEEYPGVKAYLEERVKLAKKQGYADTLYGRRRPIPELSNRNYNMRMFGERVAMNSPVQGTAADIMRIAMLRVDEELEAAGLQARIISQVHDELILEAPVAEQEAAAAILRRCMETAADLSVPLKVSLGIGSNWYDVK